MQRLTILIVGMAIFAFACSPNDSVNEAALPVPTNSPDPTAAPTSGFETSPEFEVALHQDCVSWDAISESNLCMDTGRYVFSWSLILCGFSEVLASQPNTEVTSDIESHAAWFDWSSLVILQMASDIGEIELPTRIGEIDDERAASYERLGIPIPPTYPSPEELYLRPDTISVLDDFANLYTKTAEALRSGPVGIGQFLSIPSENFVLFVHLDSVLGMASLRLNQFGISKQKYDEICPSYSLFQSS